MHQSSASHDARLRKVRMKYGAEGLGLYWTCIEEVCANVDPKLTFEVESDSEILAHELRMDTLKVEEIMRYMVEIGLFESSGNVITCFKLARYLGDKNTRNDNLKAIIQRQKEHLSPTVPDSPRQSALEERRLESNTTDKPKRFIAARMNLPAGVSASAWVDWAKYRSKKRKPISESAAKALIPDFLAYSPEEQERITQHSIKNDYQGWYPPRELKHENTNGRTGTRGDTRRLSAAERVRAAGEREFGPEA